MLNFRGVTYPLPLLYLNDFCLPKWFLATEGDRPEKIAGRITQDYEAQNDPPKKSSQTIRTAVSFLEETFGRMWAP